MLIAERSIRRGKMVNGQAGKGDRFRPFNREAWDKAWDRIEKAKKKKKSKKERKDENNNKRSV